MTKACVALTVILGSVAHIACDKSLPSGERREKASQEETSTTKEIFFDDMPMKLHPYADSVIKFYQEDLASPLPPLVRTEKEIRDWVSSQESIFEYYRYKGFLFMTLKAGDPGSQRRGEVENFGHAIIVNTKHGSYIVAYISKS